MECVGAPVFGQGQRVLGRYQRVSLYKLRKITMPKAVLSARAKAAGNIKTSTGFWEEM